jgi:hypothetical protein
MRSAKFEDLDLGSEGDRQGRISIFILSHAIPSFIPSSPTALLPNAPATSKGCDCFYDSEHLCTYLASSKATSTHPKHISLPHIRKETCVRCSCEQRPNLQVYCFFSGVQRNRDGGVLCRLAICHETCGTLRGHFIKSFEVLEHLRRFHCDVSTCAFMCVWEHAHSAHRDHPVGVCRWPASSVVACARTSQSLGYRITRSENKAHQNWLQATDIPQSWATKVCSG